MKKLIIFLLAIFTSTAAPAAPLSVNELANTAVYIRETKQVYETINNTRYEIWIKDPITKTEKPKQNMLTGTGFVVEHNGYLYLVTAAHVAKQLTQAAEFLFNNTTKDISIYTLGEIQTALPDSKWFFHPKADIAIHPWNFKTINSLEKVVIAESLWWDTSKTLSIGEQVYIFGYPLGLGAHKALSPLSKKAEVASWLTTVEVRGVDPTVKFILLDEALAQGYSGAPVFRSPGVRVVSGGTLQTGGAKLVGVQSLALSDATGGKISGVVPLNYLKEVFELNEFKTYSNRLK